MKRDLAPLVLCSVFFLPHPPTPAAAEERPRIISSSSLRQVSLDELAEDLQKARFVFLGEHHDSRRHHSMQLRVLRLLRERGVELGLALEMFSFEDGDVLERWNTGDLGSLELYDLFAQRWNAKQWSLYGDIFHYAKRQGIPMAGINVPHEATKKIVEGGFAALDEAERLGIEEVECSPGNKYLELITRARSEGAVERVSLQRFCETQVFWDSSMAVNLLRADREQPGRLWVVMTGIFHAWKHGIPAQLAGKSDAPVRVVLPSGEATYLGYDVAVSDADYVWWVTGPGEAP